MKTNFFIIISLIAVLSTSCVSSTFYQVCKITPESNITVKDNLLVYEDNNCKVLYNLWDDGGSVGFQFYNKTGINIYLNLEECFFIDNGIANNYYKNRVSTYSTNTGSANSVANSMSGLNYLRLIQTNSASETSMSTNGKSVSSKEESIICIPASTSKIIKEYSVTETPYRDCDLLRNPTKTQIKTLTFDKGNSPIVFSNRIEYKVGQTGTPIKFENKFFVSEITNYPKSEIIESRDDKYCGEVISTTNGKTEYFRNVYPDKFYIKYSWSSSEFKH